MGLDPGGRDLPGRRFEEAGELASHGLVVSRVGGAREDQGPPPPDLPEFGAQLVVSIPGPDLLPQEGDEHKGAGIARTVEDPPPGHPVPDDLGGAPGLGYRTPGRGGGRIGGGGDLEVGQGRQGHLHLHIAHHHHPGRCLPVGAVPEVGDDAGVHPFKGDGRAKKGHAMSTGSLPDPVGQHSLGGFLAPKHLGPLIAPYLGEAIRFRRAESLVQDADEEVHFGDGAGHHVDQAIGGALDLGLGSHPPGHGSHSVGSQPTEDLGGSGFLRGFLHWKGNPEGNRPTPGTGEEVELPLPRLPLDEGGLEAPGIGGDPGGLCPLGPFPGEEEGEDQKGESACQGTDPVITKFMGSTGRLFRRTS